MENIAVILSVFSTIVALISAYITQFKKGKVKVLPIRAYRAEPSNFHVENESFRAVRLFLNFTFMNTGAVPHAITDLRVRVPIKEKNAELLLEWETECSQMFSEAQERQYASQPTIGPYGSISRVYTFVSKAEPAQGKLVSALEELCSQDAKKAYPAVVEMRKSNDKWKALRYFALQHTGRRCFETDFDKINSL